MLETQTALIPIYFHCMDKKTQFKPVGTKLTTALKEQISGLVLMKGYLNLKKGSDFESVSLTTLAWLQKTF